MYLCNFSRSCE
jgi:hypothetical protein